MNRMGRQAATGLIILAGLWMAACGGGNGGSTGGGTTKTTPTVTAWPTASTITVGQTLASSTLSGGTASVSGTFAWTTASTSPSAGTASESVTFTPTDTTDYYTVTGSVSVTVNKITPTVTVTPASASVLAPQSLSVTVTVSGGTGTATPTGSVVLSGGGYTGSAATLSSGSATITIPAGSLAVGTDTLSAAYTPDTSGSATYATASGTNSVSVSLVTPTVTVTPNASSISVTQSLSVTVTVAWGTGNPTPTGSVTLSGGGYTGSATTLTSGSATFNIPANKLAVGTDTLTSNYTPDTASSSMYSNTSGTGSVTVAAVPYTLTVDSTLPSSGVTIDASPADNNSVSSSTTPFTLTYNSGSQVTLTAVNGTYSFVSWSGCTSTSGSTCTVSMSAATTVTATYNYSAVTSIAVTPSTATIGTQQQFTAKVSGTGSYSSGVTWSVAVPTGSSLSPGTISSSGLYNTPYPAPATVTVTATSTQNTSVSGSATVTLSAPTTAAGPALTVDVGTPSNSSENPHTISPYIYGVNGYGMDSASQKTANPGLIRWGGDATSRYNYQNNMTNSASDWYFENFYGGGSMFPNASSSSTFTQFFQGADSVGAAALGTVPVNGWVANSTEYACSFTKSQFPSQESFSGSCGNGVLTSGTDLNGNSGTSSTQIPDITSIQETPPNIANASASPTSSTVPEPGSVTSAWADATWTGGWVNSIVTGYGSGSSGKGVAMWDLDNEPTWWDAVHRDVHPSPFTYDEVTNNGIGTALAIKTADPTALVSGPVIDYWMAYFYSKKDIENGWSTGPCYEPWSGPTDREAHGGVPLIEYYLQQFAKYSGSSYYNMRLLDYLDIHGYFAPDYNGNSVAFTTAGDTQVQEARMNGTRVFWDSTYTDSNDTQPNYLTDSNYTTSCSPPAQAPELIPMLQKWVANDYPGTKTAIDEYNFGGLESINGAVVQADILGIFGRQGLDMGAFWPTQAFNSQGPGNYAFAMYRNYDGNNSTFGDTYLYATSALSGADAENQLAVYGAQRTADGAITVMVINKTYGSLTSTISLENFSAASGTTAAVYQYSNANLTAIVQETAVAVTPPTGSGTTSTISYTFPAQSITLLVIPD